VDVFKTILTNAGVRQCIGQWSRVKFEMLGCRLVYFRSGNQRR